MSKFILITGATSGFGEGIAYKFAQHKYNIIITGRRQAKLDTLAQKLINKYDVQVLPLCFDISNRKEVEKYLTHLPSVFQKIDILVNNAGLASGLDFFQDMNINDWEIMIDTNIKGLLYVTKCILPNMIKQQSGHIINIGSIAGKEVYPKGNIYCATKYAVDAITKAIRVDTYPHNIRVTQIAPGLAETEFSLVRFHGNKERAKQSYQGVKPLVAEDIAECVFFAANAPTHVNIADIVITPTAQATVNLINRKL
ncbi:MAG: SDR family NAD(P)-dependent oxidoreductase [Chitinophagaceae bacterium]